MQKQIKSTHDENILDQTIITQGIKLIQANHYYCYY